ncbi:TPA: FAD-binding oxidoreductase [Candidatus Bipolaricaulota bacterium]|nr:FAD-binding oxidoreductase [Candidatus Bipolaricaulota bacterium]
MKASADVVIIGAGVTGAALAYELARRGIRDVLVLERAFPCSGATGRCGGGIRQQFTTPHNIRLAMESVKRYETLSEELGVDIEFIQGGYLILAETEREREAQRQAVALQNELGLPSRLLTPREAKEVLPLLDETTIVGATYCPTDAHANPFRVVEGYLARARERGVALEKFTPVVNLEVKGGRIVRVRTCRGDVVPGVVVNAAGAWSGEIARMAGVELPNRPIRHEIAITEPVEFFMEVMVISIHNGIYFSQTVEGQIIGGIGDPEEKPGYDVSSSLGFLRRYARELLRYVPALGQLAVLRQWAGLYDVTPDAQPILGPTPGLENLIQANGYSGHGFMIAPKVAELLADYIEKDVVSEELACLSLSRFMGEVKGEAFVVG